MAEVAEQPDQAPAKKHTWVPWVVGIASLFLIFKAYNGLFGDDHKVSNQCVGVARSGAPDGGDKVHNICQFPVVAIACLDHGGGKFNCGRVRTYYPGDTYAKLAGEGQSWWNQMGGAQNARIFACRHGYLPKVPDVQSRDFSCVSS